MHQSKPYYFGATSEIEYIIEQSLDKGNPPQVGYTKKIHIYTISRRQLECVSSHWNDTRWPADEQVGVLPNQDKSSKNSLSTEGKMPA